MSEWLCKTEKSLHDDEIKLTFLPELEEQLQKYRVYNIYECIVISLQGKDILDCAYLKRL
jgi:hypothetical protein